MTDNGLKRKACIILIYFIVLKIHCFMFLFSRRNEEHRSGRFRAPGDSCLAAVTHLPFFNPMALHVFSMLLFWL